MSDTKKGDDLGSLNSSEVDDLDAEGSEFLSDGGVGPLANDDNLDDFGLDEEDADAEVDGGVERGLSWDEYSEEAGRRGKSKGSTSSSIDGLSLVPMVGGRAFGEDSFGSPANPGVGDLSAPSLVDLEIEAATLVDSDDLDRLISINQEIVARLEPNVTIKNYATLIDAYLALSDVYIRQNRFRDAYQQKILAINVKQTQAPANNVSELHYVIQQYCDVGNYARIAGDIDHSEWYLTEAFNIAVSVFGDNAKELGPICLGYGELMLVKSQYIAAVQYLERALELLNLDLNISSELKVHARFSLAKAFKLQAQDAIRRSEEVLGVGYNNNSSNNSHRGGQYVPSASQFSIDRMSSITSMHSDAQKIVQSQLILDNLHQHPNGSNILSPRLYQGGALFQESTISSYPYDNNAADIRSNNDQLDRHLNGGLNEQSIITNNDNESYFTELDGTLPLEQESSIYADLAFGGDANAENDDEEAAIIQANLLALAQQRAQDEKEVKELLKREREEQLEIERLRKREYDRARVLSARKKRENEDYKYGYKLKIVNNVIYACCIPLEFEDLHSKRKNELSNGKADDEASATYSSDVLKTISTFDKGIKEYLCRTKDESAYYDSCNKIFSIPCFPIDKLLKKGGKYRLDVMDLSRMIVSYRVRRLVIEDELHALSKEINATIDLQDICAAKSKLVVERIVMLEKEMTKLTTLFLPASKYDERFSAMLSTHAGWNVISTYLHREFKRLRLAAQGGAAGEAAAQAHSDASEAVDRELTTETVVKTWNLMQEWLIAHSIVMRCKLGKEGYPIASRDLAGPDNNDGVQALIENPTSTLGSIINEGSSDGGSGHHHHHEHLSPFPRLDFECIAEWESISEFFEIPNYMNENGEDIPDYRLLSVLKAYKARIDDSPIYFGVSNVLLSDIALGINELTEFDESSVFLGACLSQVMGYIGEMIESEIMVSIRHYSMWNKILERMRKDRVKKSSGKLIVKEYGVLEIDIAGNEFLIPNAETHVDTDLVHHSMQRIHLHILGPILEKKLKVASHKAHLLKGELQVLVQCLYMHAAPYIQRAFRGTLQRMKTPLVMRDLALHSMHAACLVLQSWLRSKIGKMKYNEQLALRKEQFKNKSAYVIQSWMRTYAKWKIYQRYKKNKAEKSLMYAVTHFQAMIRGFNDRARDKKRKNQAAEELKKEIEGWSVIVIQKLARGYIARKTIVKSLRIRKALSNQTLEIAERFLKGGDVWRFLKEIDAEIHRLNTEISDTNKREDDWADSFIKQVLDKRKADFDSAWNRFSKAVKPTTTVNPSSKPMEIGDDFMLSAIGDIDKSMINNKLPADSNGTVYMDGGHTFRGKSAGGGSRSGRTVKKELLDDSLSSPQLTSKSSKLNKSGSGRTELPGQRSMESAMSGPLLRRAITTTLQESVKAEMERQKLGEAKNSKLLDDIRDAYSSGPSLSKPASLSPIKPGKKKKTDMLGRKIENIGKIQSASADWVTNAVTGSGGNGGIASDEVSVNSAASVSTDQIGSPLSKTTRSTDRSSSPSKVKGNNNRAGTTDRVFGENLLVDIPLGVNDTIEHLFHAAALRSYVPEFFQGSGMNAEESYQMYLQLPKGLARMRYESESWKWSQVYINRLRQKGLTRIKQLLPMTFFRNHLKSVETPSLLINKVIDIYLDLKKIGEEAFNTSENQKAKDGYKMIENGLITLKQEIELSKSIPSSSSAVLSTYSDASTLTGTNTSASAATIEVKAPATVDPELPSKLLLSMVEGGNWTDLNGPMEDFLMYVAYLVVPFVPYLMDKSKKRGKPRSVTDTDDNGSVLSTTSTADTIVSIEDEAGKMGQHAFKMHINEVQSMTDEKDKREAIKSRFRAALIVTTPYILKLQAEGISTVFDLVKIDFTRFQMPFQLQNQIESCLSVAVALSKNAKIVPTVRDHLSQSKDLFTVAMIYDPKFQRGPFDPYGKPSPLMSLRDIIKAKKTQNAIAESLKPTNQVEFPDAIWNVAPEVVKIDESDGKKMFDFHVHAQSHDSGHLSGIPDSSEHESKMMKAAIAPVPSSKQGVRDHHHHHHHHHKHHKHGHNADSDHHDHKSHHRDHHDNASHEGSSSKNTISLDSQSQTTNATTVLSSTSSSNTLKKSKSSSIGSNKLSKVTGSTTGAPASATANATNASSKTTKPVKKPLTEKQLARQAMDEEAKIFAKDFIQYAKEDFRRPYKCSHIGCNQSFSKINNLKIHEKGHKLFAAYHSYKQDPQLFYDLDSSAIRDEKVRNYEASVTLPPIAQNYVNTLTMRTNTTMSQRSLDDRSFQSYASLGGRSSSADANLSQAHTGLNASLKLSSSLSRISAAKNDSNVNIVSGLLGLKFGATLDLTGVDDDEDNNHKSFKSVRFEDEVKVDRQDSTQSNQDDSNIDLFSETIESSFNYASNTATNSLNSTNDNNEQSTTSMNANTIFGDDEYHENYVSKYNSSPNSKSFSSGKYQSRPQSQQNNDREKLLDFYNSIKGKTLAENDVEVEGEFKERVSFEDFDRDVQSRASARLNPFLDSHDKIYQNSNMFLETI